MQTGQESEGLGLNPSAMGCIQCARTGGQWLAHSLRTGRLGPVPACVQPLPVGLNAGNEANWTPAEVGDQTVRSRENMGVNRMPVNERYVYKNKATEDEREELDIIVNMG